MRSLVVALAFAVRAAGAEDAPAGNVRRIEEIIVTAQKTEQSLGEVPISLIVLDNDLIREMGISDIHDLIRFVPNVHFLTQNTGIIFIRGLGTPFPGSAFDPTVGLSLDELTMPDAWYLADPLFDVERIVAARRKQPGNVGL
ncbi:MAG: hypothetical protein ACREQ9_05665 [Candidatus Binatia bacterium]